MHKSISSTFTLGGLLLLTGCAPIQPRTVDLSGTMFNAVQAGDLIQPGPNTIKGGAFMRQVGGGVVTCAGEEVALVPATQYAAARMRALYGTDGEFGANTSRYVAFSPDIEGYAMLTRRTRCDAQGNFIFEKVANGTFYITTTVRWSVSRSEQGSKLMQRTAVKDGAIANLVISP
jgi:hypothetical protein